jgi:sugar lactone lactonase YvrE
MDRMRIVTWIAALAALAAPGLAVAQGGSNPCDKNHYILHQKCSPADFPGTVIDGIATKTSIGMPNSVAVDAAGNVFFGSYQGVVYRVDTSGTLTLVALPGRPATGTEWYDYWNIFAALGNAGDVYLIDVVNNLVQRLDVDGTLVTVAGRSDGDYVYDEDLGQTLPANGIVVGSRATDLYMVPDSVTVDGVGNLYITSSRADLDGLVKVAPDGTVSAFTPFACGDPGPDGICESSGHIAVDDAGNVFIPDYRCRIHVIAASGAFDVFAGSGYGYGSASYTTCLHSGDGVPAKSAGLGVVLGIAAGTDGSVYFADYEFNCIRRVGIDGIVRTVAGSCPGPWQFQGVLLDHPQGVAVDAAGNVYIADTNNERVLKLAPDGVMTTIAGTMPAVPQQP